MISPGFEPRDLGGEPAASHSCDAEFAGRNVDPGERECGRRRRRARARAIASR
jgi:hypothetical protein